MRENWTNGQNRFKALQTQARATRDEKIVLTNELAELRAKMDAGSSSNVRIYVSPKAPAARLTLLVLFQANTEAQQAELQSKITSLEAEKAALETRMREQEATIDTRLKEQTASLEARIKEQEEQRLQLVETFKVTEAKLIAERDEKEESRAKQAAREKPIFEDNVSRDCCCRPSYVTQAHSFLILETHADSAQDGHPGANRRTHRSNRRAYSDAREVRVRQRRSY